MRLAACLARTKTTTTAQMRVDSLPKTHSLLGGSCWHADKDCESDLCNNPVYFCKALRSLHPVPYEYACLIAMSISEKAVSYTFCSYSQHRVADFRDVDGIQFRLHSFHGASCSVDWWLCDLMWDSSTLGKSQARVVCTSDYWLQSWNGWGMQCRPICFLFTYHNFDKVWRSHIDLLSTIDMQQQLMLYCRMMKWNWWCKPMLLNWLTDSASLTSLKQNSDWTDGPIFPRYCLTMLGSGCTVACRGHSKTLYGFWLVLQHGYQCGHGGVS